jgi:hypothetical protein
LKVKFDIPKIDQNRTVTNLLSAAMFFQYFRCSQVKRLGKRPVLWEDSLDQGIRLPAGVFRWQDDNRAVVHVLMLMLIVGVQHWEFRNFES